MGALASSLRAPVAFLSGHMTLLERGRISGKKFLTSGGRGEGGVCQIYTRNSLLSADEGRLRESGAGRRKENVGKYFPGRRAQVPFIRFGNPFGWQLVSKKRLKAERKYIRVNGVMGWSFFSHC